MDAPAASAASETIRVELGDRSYDIRVGSGLIANAGAALKRTTPGANAFIVTDENVAAHHLASLKESLAGAGIGTAEHIVSAGESSKSFPVLEQVVDAVLGAKMERGDVVIALGGGVVGDLAGFAAAISRRGMNLIQIPTSLLAQVDSSVGGKTGINTARGKNLVGAFYQPRLVLADTATLETLPDRQFRAGYAEVAKYGLIGDAAFFDWLEASWRDVFKPGAARIRAIATSCAAKAGVVAADEREAGRRALLNLGHTFGHAFEAATGYSDRLIHGEAIAIGMVLAARFSAELGHAPADIADRVKAHFSAVGLPTEMGDVPGGLPSASGLLDLIAQDKKVSRGQLTFVLLRSIGDAFVERGIESTTLTAFLDRQSAR